jgi:hypothetical protein
MLSKMTKAEREFANALAVQISPAPQLTSETKRGGWTAIEESQVVDWALSNPQKNGERCEAWLAPLCKILNREFNSVYQKLNRLRNANHI